MTVSSFSEMLERIEELRKKYASGQIKLNAQGMYSLIMAGAFDGICGNDDRTFAVPEDI